MLICLCIVTMSPFAGSTGITADLQLGSGSHSSAVQARFILSVAQATRLYASRLSAPGLFDSSGADALTDR
jgi:hypothetical protein